MKTQHILLIDDDPVINFIHHRIVLSEFPDSTVVILENGARAIEYIRNNHQISFLIFLDINMPIMNGWQFLETLTHEPNKYNVTALYILTSSVDLRDKKRAKENKMVLSYIAKPLTREVLKEIKAKL